ncbi:MAG: phosphate acetyltransferase [Candidatus Shapirobacteria bacterium]|nr:phosphate acetyltransferase [Candidatus Shapirobacteria bacterium]
MSKFINEIKIQAKKYPQTIVLADGLEARTIKAANIIIKQKIAKLILLGNRDQILKLSPLLDHPNVQIIDPENNQYSQRLSQKLFELRQHKGLILTEAQKLVKNPYYLATLLVYEKLADGSVGGANQPSSEILRPALQILKTSTSASTFFIMSVPKSKLGLNGNFLFADCSLNINPSAQDLAQIAIDSADSFKFIFKKKAKVALISYSTHGSGKGESVDKILLAKNIVQNQRPDIIIDGDLQVDAAIVPLVSQLKSPNSKLKGQANVLIFPDLNSANIAYKLTQRLANAQAIGPIFQGISRPINDLSRGCTVQDIVDIVVVTCLQSHRQLTINTIAKIIAVPIQV